MYLRAISQGNYLNPKEMRMGSGNCLSMRDFIVRSVYLIKLNLEIEVRRV